MSLKRISNIKNTLEKAKKKTVYFDKDILISNIENVIYDIGNILICAPKLFALADSMSQEQIDNYLQVMRTQFLPTLSSIEKINDESLDTLIHITDQLLSLLNMMKDLNNGRVEFNGYSSHFTLPSYNIKTDVRYIIDEYTKLNRDINMLEITPENISNSLGRKRIYTKHVNLYVAFKPEIKNLDSPVIEHIASFAKRFLLGGIEKAISITNDAFDIAAVYLDQEDISHKIKTLDTNYKILERTTRYVKPGGYLLLPVRIGFTHKNLISLMATYYDDIHFIQTIKKSERSSFSKKTEVCIIAKKKSKGTYRFNKDVYKTLCLTLSLGKDDTIITKKEASDAGESCFTFGLTDTCTTQKKDDQNFIMHMPGVLTPIANFQGSIIDPNELINLYNSSNLTHEVNNLKYKNRNTTLASPPLPFNTGQIGIVLTSGCLDGIVEEDDTNCHIVKGQVIKYIDEISDYDSTEDTTTITKITSNRSEINAFLPDGTYKRLI